MADLLVNEKSVGKIKSVKNGMIHFMPSRGQGHLVLASKMRESGRCEAVLRCRGKTKDVVVIDYPEYGVLVIEEAQLNAETGAADAAPLA